MTLLQLTLFLAMVTLGAGIGLYAGRLLHLVLIEREKRAVRRFAGVVTFMLGGGSGGVILDFLTNVWAEPGTALGAYALGLGAALIVGWFIDSFHFGVTGHVWRDSSININRVRDIILLSDMLRGQEADPLRRAELITPLIASPDSLPAEAQADVVQSLGPALDQLIDRGD